MLPVYFFFAPTPEGEPEHQHSCYCHMSVVPLLEKNTVISCCGLLGLSQCDTSLVPSVDAMPGQKYDFISHFLYAKSSQV